MQAFFILQTLALPCSAEYVLWILVVGCRTLPKRLLAALCSWQVTSFAWAAALWLKSVY